MVAYGAPYPVAMPDRTRVATFNVHHCEGLDGRVDIARIAGVMAETGAELIAIQELDRHLPRSGSVDQPVELAAVSGMNVVFHPTLTRRRGDYGIAIATREALDVSFEPLPRIGDEEPRGLLRTVWRGVTIIATHLSRDAAAKAAQIEALADAIPGLPAPALLLGDLNAEARLLGPLEAAGLERCDGAPTMPAKRPRRQIDHVLGGPGVTVHRCWTIRTEASDHRPLVAEIEIE
jgi:endonuclease/exonuclease/phosphatase family metal-dependent hydrolase